MKRLFLFLIVLLNVIPGHAVFAESSSHILTTSDWAEEALIAKNKEVPILVIFSSDNCVYCEKLKQLVIKPMLNSGTLSRFAHVREFNMGRGGKVIDFDGDPIRSRIFISRYGVFATPTVVFLDYNGDQLSSPIVGFDGVDQYSDHLAEALQNALESSALQHASREVESGLLLANK